MINQFVQEVTKKFREFLDKDFDDGSYYQKTEKLVAEKRNRLVISLQHLREFDSDFQER